MPDKLKVSVSGDEMSAFIRLPVDRDVSIEELRNALAAGGISVGISPVALRKAIAGQRGVFHQIAWGICPEGSPSSPPVVVVKFPGSLGVPPDRMETGPGFRAAWKRLKDRGAVNTGDMLAFLRNPDKHPKAVTVTGNERTCVDFARAIQPGKNAKTSRDGTSIVASRYGIPYQCEHEVSVLDHVEIVGDVDSLTGDLSFPGDLSIRGSVQAGFRVSSAGNIMISGNLSGSATARGMIVVSGGINSPGESVESGMGVTCRFCENSLIRSSGPIKVSEAVIHSVIETEAYVDVSGNPGRIVGGLIRAADGISAGTAGTNIGIPTVLEIGVSPRKRHEQARLERDLAKVRDDLEKASRTGRRPSREVGDYDNLRLKRMKKLWQEQEVVLEKRLRSFNEALEKLPGGFFDAKEVLPGVKLVMVTTVTEFTNPVTRLAKGVVRRETD